MIILLGTSVMISYPVKVLDVVIKKKMLIPKALTEYTAIFSDNIIKISLYNNFIT